MVLVMRCEDTYPVVPSRIIVCTNCGKNCWLSKYSGKQTLALAAKTGDPRIICSVCFTDMGYVL